MRESSPIPGIFVERMQSCGTSCTIVKQNTEKARGKNLLNKNKKKL